MSDSGVPSWAMLFEDADFGGRHLTVFYRDSIENMKETSSDDDREGFNDKASSAMYCIAYGVTCRLYEHSEHEGRKWDLVGSGELEKIRDFKEIGFNDKTSSLMWC